MIAAVDHQPLALVEHRAVRGVVVGAVGPAGDDHAIGRRSTPHGPDLARRGMGAQHAPPAAPAAPAGRTCPCPAWPDDARGCSARRNCASRPRSPARRRRRTRCAPKIATISSMVRLIGWISPAGEGRGGSVMSSRSAAISASHAAASKCALPLGNGGLELALEPVQRRAALPPLLRRQRAKIAQKPGQPSLPAEQADAQRVERGQIAAHPRSPRRLRGRALQDRPRGHRSSQAARKL